MTAAINRNRPWVDSKGALTQYGWSVMQSVWVAIGGATSSAPSVDVDQFAFAPLATLPSVSIAADISPSVVLPLVSGDVAPVFHHHAHAGDVGPV